MTTELVYIIVGSVLAGFFVGGFVTLLAVGITMSGRREDEILTTIQGQDDDVDWGDMCFIRRVK